MKRAQPVRPQKRRREPAVPRDLHITVVQSFLTHYCVDFPWQRRALGLLRSRSIQLLMDLAEELEHQFLRETTTASDTVVTDAKKFLVIRQFKALITKYQYSPDLIDLNPGARALQNFLQAERRNRRLNTIFRGHFIRGTERHWGIPLIRKHFQRALGERPFYERILEGCDFSGGATTMHSGTKTHLAAKLGASKIQGNEGALPFFLLAIERNYSYMEQFAEIGKENPTIFCIDRTKIRENIVGRWENCCYNVVKVVPKNAKSGRTIAKESPGNNLVQKGIDLEMRRLLETHYGINLKFQEPNQLLAMHGSLLDCEDPYVTIDVKDASTSVITWLVRSLSNPFWFELLNKTRSAGYKLETPESEETPYELFASMGNGFCFPLETHIFAAICKAAYEHCGARPDFRCYGDDIVVRQSVALVVVELLNACGFRVNTSKTFIIGPFRESCGADWYGGQDVTPGYYKDPITDLAGAYALHNSLRKWPLVQQDIRAAVTKNHHVVDDTPAYAWVSNQAFRVPLDVAMVHPQTTWDAGLQTWSYAILSTIPTADSEWEDVFTGSSPERMRVTAAYRGGTHDEPFHLRFTTTRRTTRTTSPRGITEPPYPSGWVEPLPRRNPRGTTKSPPEPMLEWFGKPRRYVK